MTEKIVIDLCAGKKGVHINFGDSPEISIWMSIRNYTPFDQKLDMMTIEYRHAGVDLELRSKQKHTIPAFGEQDVYFRTRFSESDARKIASAKERFGEPYLGYTADFHNRLYEVHKFGAVESFMVYELNAHLHRNSKKAA